ncbi:MAG TPA: glycosyltransferase family A protein [Noviherbaspirillum sp.]|nr:glycosyltransferase family A protein [Noviherbaspirillum sp.]
MSTFDVLLPVKNGMPYLPEAIDSIRKQTFRDWRLLVLDHGSNDGSVETVHAYAAKDPRIVLHYVPSAKGWSGLLNHGLERCDCRYVLQQDVDAFSMPDRMAVLLQALEKDPELVMAGSRGIVVDASSKPVGTIDVPTSHAGILSSMPFRTPVAHSTAAVRLTALHRIGARYGIDFVHALPPERRMEVPGLAEDYFLFGQLALAGKCINVERNLIERRYRSANVGSTRYVEQMRLALAISRYLAESLSIVRGGGAPAFDPAPFCNHGQSLFAVEGKSNFLDEYEAMQAVMRRSIVASYERERELAFRRAIAVRTNARMAGRYFSFASRHGRREFEWRTVRSWALRHLRRKNMLALTPTGLASPA